MNSVLLSCSHIILLISQYIIIHCLPVQTPLVSHVFSPLVLWNVLGLGLAKGISEVWNLDTN